MLPFSRLPDTLSQVIAKYCYSGTNFCPENWEAMHSLSADYYRFLPEKITCVHRHKISS
jgi:hypothetical protein